MGLYLGTVTKMFGEPLPEVEVADPEINDYVDSLVFREMLIEAAKAAKVPESLIRGWRRWGEPRATPPHAIQPDALLNPHTAVFGVSGTGKTQFMLSLVRQHFSSKASVIAVDPQMASLQSVAQAALDAGIPASKITFMTPLETGYVAGWNPLVVRGQPVSESVDDLVTLFGGVFSESWGPRLEMLLSRALTVLATHGLSLYELPHFLQNADYRTNLLATVQRPQGAGRLYEDSCDFFLNDFNRWPGSEQRSAVGPVANKVDAILRNDFFFGTFCGRGSSFQFADFWSEQRVLLVHMAEGKFDPTGIRLLGALVAQQLYRTALAVGKGAPRNVVLWLDELGVQGRHFGATLQNIIRIARAQQLQLLTAAQDLEQIDDKVLGSLMGAATRVFFNLVGQDSRRIASDLSDTIVADKAHPRERVVIAAMKNGTELVFERREYAFGRSVVVTSTSLEAARVQYESAKSVEEAASARFNHIRSEIRKTEAALGSWFLKPSERGDLHRTLASLNANNDGNKWSLDKLQNEMYMRRNAYQALSHARQSTPDTEYHALQSTESLAWLEKWTLYHWGLGDGDTAAHRETFRSGGIDVCGNRIRASEYLQSFPLQSFGPGRSFTRFAIERRGDCIYIIEWFPRVIVTMRSESLFPTKDDWALTLRGLKRQDAVIHIAGNPPLQVRTPVMPNMRSRFEADPGLVASIMRDNRSNSIAAIEAIARQRLAEIGRISRIRIGSAEESAGTAKVASVSGPHAKQNRRVVPKVARPETMRKVRPAPPKARDDSL